MEKGIIAILSVALVFAVMKWCLWKISAKAIAAAYARWVEEHGIEQPSSDTVKAYQSWAVKNAVEDLFHSR